MNSHQFVNDFIGVPAALTCRMTWSLYKRGCEVLVKMKGPKGYFERKVFSAGNSLSYRDMTFSLKTTQINIQFPNKLSVRLTKKGHFLKMIMMINEGEQAIIGTYQSACYLMIYDNPEGVCDLDLINLMRLINLFIFYPVAWC